VVCVVFGVAYIALSAHAIKYMKGFACKIKIIANRAEEKWVKSKNFFLQNKSTKSEKFLAEEQALKNEVKRSRSLYFLNVFGCML